MMVPIADDIGGKDCCEAAHRAHSGNPPTAFLHRMISLFR
jgi:hypothetical protein